ncbi:hypothetical protein J6590_011161 [Homalodisca vitripennis]|nr:hypothetical protein J6590_011161 [Homalodisca vitripennis]
MDANPKGHYCTSHVSEGVLSALCTRVNAKITEGNGEFLYAVFPMSVCKLRVAPRPVRGLDLRQLVVYVVGVIMGFLWGGLPKQLRWGIIYGFGFHRQALAGRAPLPRPPRVTALSRLPESLARHTSHFTLLYFSPHPSNV